MSDLSRFLKELDEQAHNDSVFSMFDDFDKKYADFTARRRSGRRRLMPRGRQRPRKSTGINSGTHISRKSP